MQLNEYLATTLGALQASVSVLLILFYGFGLRKYDWISPDGEHNIDGLSAKIFLPALLFSQIGPQATMENVKHFWPIIVLAIVYQGISIGVGLFARRFLRFPAWIVPALVFNNVTSLPLLMVQSLQKTGALDTLLWRADDTVDAAASRARSYILLNALVCNVTRFALGPKLMSHHGKEDDEESHPDGDGEGFPHERDPLLDDYDYTVHVQGVPHNPNSPPSKTDRLKSHLTPLVTHLKPVITFLQPVYTFLGKFANPPLVGGILAVVFGLIPPLHTVFFGKNSPLEQTFTTSIENMGNLYTVLQMLVLGSKLKSKKGAKVAFWPLFFVFLWRFAVMPAISLSTVYFARKWVPNIVRRDPVLDFVLAIAPVGPPAITLAAIAEMANLGPDEDGKVARMLTLSYLVTPLISLPVAAAVKIAEISE